MLRASDSSTVRNSGSPMSRRLSPSSTGIDFRLGGARCVLSAGRSTSPCRSLTRGDRAITKEAVHPFDDFGDDMLDQRSVRGRHHQLQDAIAFLARREADRFGCAGAGVTRADDFGPARDHAGLHEAEFAKGGAPDFGHQFGNRPCKSAARPFLAAALTRAALSPAARALAGSRSAWFYWRGHDWRRIRFIAFAAMP